MATFSSSARLRHGSRRMLYLVDRFVKAHSEASVPVDPDTVAAWALSTGMYRPEPVDQQVVLRRKIRAALRDDYIEDPQGREVHAHQPEMVEVHTSRGIRWRSRWYKTFEMPPDKMRIAGQLRRRSAFRDVLQIHIDFESYNDNNIFKAKLKQLDFNFNADIEEFSMPTKYEEPDGPTLEDEDEDESES